jgi:epoxyqueuosine reductase
LARAPRQAPEDFIRDRARAEGFDSVGITRELDLPSAREGLMQFLAQDFHGDMGWMKERAGQRASPNALWPEARSAIVLGLSYAPDEDPLALLGQRSRANISVYARGDDYHDVIKKRLKKIARSFGETYGADVKVFVDTAPLMEKPLAQAAGLGWQGKHTNLVSRTQGSWLFLGVILTTLEMTPDEPTPDHCGSCRSCLDACPTKAFPSPYRLDARRCISYLTIEHKGPIPHEFRATMGNRIYGCDDCLAACPWNKFAQASRELAFAAREVSSGASLSELVGLDDPAFRQLFRASPVKRIGRERFVRNVLIAIGNSGDTALIPQAVSKLQDQSPLVRGAAVWALRRLCAGDELARIQTSHEAQENDPSVKAEWTAELARPL